MLVSTEAGGLGNRIKSWVSAWRIDPAARVHWPVTDNMPAEFADLFINDCAVNAMPDDATPHRSWRLAIQPEDEAHLPAGFATAGGGAHTLIRRAGKLWWQFRGRPDDRYRYMITAKRFPRSTRRDGRLIDFEYGRIPQYFLDLYAPFFAAISIRPEISERVETFAARNLDDTMIGVQVRTWRDDARRHRRHYRPAKARLEALLAATDADRRFFVVSDDDDVVPWMSSLVGSRRVVAFDRDTDRLGSWRSKAGMVEDLIDMLLLARTDELFASYLSTFSETAWWLGGATAEVTVV